MEKVDSTHELFVAAVKHTLKKDANLTQAALAKAIGVTAANLSGFLNLHINYSETKRKEISSHLNKSYLEILAFGFELVNGHPLVAAPGESFINKETSEPRPLIIQTRTGKEQDFLEKNAANYRGVPLFESGKLAAWSNGSAFDIHEKADSEMVVYLPELGHHANHNLVGARVGGDSMEPLIPEDSIVIVDLDDTEFVDNQVFVVAINDGGVMTAAVKRVRKAEEAKGFILQSENTDYAPRVVVESDWLRLCIGRVIWMWRSFNG